MDGAELAVVADEIWGSKQSVIALSPVRRLATRTEGATAAMPALVNLLDLSSHPIVVSIRVAAVRRLTNRPKESGRPEGLRRTAAIA